MKRIKKDKLPSANYEIVLQMKYAEVDEFIEVSDTDEIEHKAILEFSSSILI